MVDISGGANIIQTGATLDSSSNSTDISAYDASLAFVQGWNDKSSPVYQTDSSIFTVDPAFQPRFVSKVDVYAEPDTNPGANNVNSDAVTVLDNNTGKSFLSKNGVGATIGGAVGCVGVAALAFLGIYGVRRHQARRPTSTTLRVYAV